MGTRRTTPPRVLPLLPIGLVAIALGGLVVDLAAGALMVVGIVDRADDASTGTVVLTMAGELAVAVGLAFALKWLVEHWQQRHDAS